MTLHTISEILKTLVEHGTAISESGSFKNIFNQIFNFDVTLCFYDIKRINFLVCIEINELVNSVYKNQN